MLQSCAIPLYYTIGRITPVVQQGGGVAKMQRTYYMDAPLMRNKYNKKNKYLFLQVFLPLRILN